MKPIQHRIMFPNRNFRVEIFPFGDVHIGKSNCNESAVKSQVKEILKRSKMKDREVRVIFGGDICEYIRPGDVKRFNANALAEWMFKGSGKDICDRLNNVADAQLKRAVQIFEPIKHLAIGAIEGNHEYSMMHYNNVNVHHQFCERMGVPDLTDESMILFKFSLPNCGGTSIKLYIQHGHGGGRTAGAEANHLAQLRAEWEDADVVMRGHSHTFHSIPPKTVMVLPTSGKVIDTLLPRYRHAFNWGCWLNSHQIGPSTYESRASYPSRAMMTAKVVVWPFYRVQKGGMDRLVPKIELRSYSIL